MNFARFSRFGKLSNWGSYSPAEQALLDKEIKVSDAFKSSEAFVKRETGTLQLFVRFMSIRLNNSIKDSEIPEIDRELTEMLKDLKEERLKTLDKLGADAPGAAKPFVNHQPDALIGEIRTYLGTRKAQGFNPDPLQSGFVIHLNLKAVHITLKQFQTVMDSGAKVLWTLDVNDILSIGDPRSAKHSIVAVGKDVQGAGIAQLKINEKKDMYLSIEDYKTRLVAYQREYDKKPSKLYLAQMKSMREDIAIWQKTLGDWTPEQETDRTVVLDFDSGHYTPSAAWGPSASAWNAAGFKVQWSRDARHV